MKQQKKENFELDFGQILLLIYHRIPVVAAAAVLGAAAALLVSMYGLKPMYTSTAKIYILTNSESMISLNDLQVGSSLANDYEELIKSRPVVEQVAENLELGMNYEELLGCIGIINPTGTRIIRIQAVYGDPAAAMQIANEFAEVSRKQISEIMKVEEPSIVETAVAAKQQSSPNNRKNTILGGMAGLILCILILGIRQMLDDTIKTAEDVERYLDLNMLAAIPDEGGTDNSEKKEKKRLHGIRKGQFK